MSWFYLILAGMLEIGWPLGLKLAQQEGYRWHGFAAALACIATWRIGWQRRDDASIDRGATPAHRRAQRLAAGADASAASGAHAVDTGARAPAECGVSMGQKVCDHEPTPVPR